MHVHSVVWSRGCDTTVHSSAHSLYSNMLKMCILERPPYQFLCETTIFTSLVIRVSYQYTPSSSHDLYQWFLPTSTWVYMEWYDTLHHKLIGTHHPTRVVREGQCTTRYFCGNAYWRKPYSRGFDSLSNEYGFREDKSKLKNRSTPVCIARPPKFYFAEEDTPGSKRSTSKSPVRLVHKSVTSSCTSQSPIVWCNATPV